MLGFNPSRLHVMPRNELVKDCMDLASTSANPTVRRDAPGVALRCPGSRGGSISHRESSHACTAPRKYDQETRYRAVTMYQERRRVHPVGLRSSAAGRLGVD